MIRLAVFVMAIGAACGGLAGQSSAADRLNVLLITMDDLNCDSVGAFGCKLQDTTPNIDRLASQSLRFAQAHVQVGNCMPSRNVMFSGRYPHTNRIEGFYQVRSPGYPVLADLVKEAGYFTGIRGKVPHSTPYSPYPAWDLVLDKLPSGEPAHPKNVESYYLSTQHGIAQAKQAGKPFYLNINISDPHKPFFNETPDDPHRPSRIFTASEVPVPGFLFDDQAVREELALYYSSVRRGDDCLGQVLRALDESGQAENTLVMYLSDHGMPLPFAKTQLYYHSTRTPWMVRWPGVTKAGAVDERHMISSIDMLPTLLDVLGLAHPKGLEGRSFAPLLKGETQEGRDYIVTEYNENSGGFRHPIRAIVTRDFGYIFSPWSNGQRVMATATKGTVTYRRMRALAPTDPKIAARLELFERRVPEELYHYAADPDALRNLIESPEHRAERDRLTALLEAWMVKTSDPMLEVFRGRHDPQVREAYMTSIEKEAADRKGPGKKKKKKKAAPDDE
jgi:N-sulfoglucosamine sulfohydrolase